MTLFNCPIISLRKTFPSGSPERDLRKINVKHLQCMEIGPQDSIYPTRQPSKSIDLIVTDKPHHQMPHRVTEPPDVQLSNLLATEQNISYY